MRKKSAVLGIFVIVVGMAVSGCGRKNGAGIWDADEDSIYITKALEVESAMVYDSNLENEFYEEDTMAEYTRKFLVEYNTEQGAAAEAENREGAEKLPVALKSCLVDGQNGRLVFEYAEPKDFVGFYQEYKIDSPLVTSLTARKVSEELTAGGLLDKSFVTPSGNAVESGEVTKQSGYSVVAIEGAAAVYTEGKIQYVSEGVTMKGDYAVMTPEGKSYIIFK